MRATSESVRNASHDTRGPRKAFESGRIGTTCELYLRWSLTIEAHAPYPFVTAVVKWLRAVLVLALDFLTLRVAPAAPPGCTQRTTTCRRD